MLTGCVQAERTRYFRHLHTIVEPGPAGNRDLAMAFGLDEFAEPDALAAAVREGDEDSRR